MKVKKHQKIAIVMGSQSDYSTMNDCVKILKSLKISFDVKIVSAHRTPKRLFEFAKKSETSYSVIIAGAGGSAHLPGMIASLTTIPVIGVPIETKALSGIDSMLSILQMPRGIPVATVAIGGGLNAGLLAAQILGTSDSDIDQKLLEYRNRLYTEVVAKDHKLSEIGSSSYLSEH